MPHLRSEFYSTLRQMLLVSEFDLLTDRYPPNDRHNISARILRQGLAISAFASLEKYLESRTEFLVSEIPNSRITDTAMGDELREFLSVDAIRGLANRLNFSEPALRQSFADTHLASLARYSSSPAAYTALGFSPRGSNVSDADIHKVLKVFGVDKPWDKLGKIAREIGSTRISLKQDYISLSRTRHKSAHQPNTNIPSTDLRSHIEIAVLIGICFDCACRIISRAMTIAKDFGSFESLVQGTALEFRFLDLEIGGTCAERISGSMNVIRRYKDETSAISGSLLRKGHRNIVLRDIQSIPIAMI